MYDLIYIILALLFVKHWYIDFVDQSAEEVASKGIYLKWAGIAHSLKHGIGTMFVLLACSVGFYIALFFAFVDFVLHYHIDWTKMNFGNRDISTPQFWNHLGLDQMAHYFVYLFIVWGLF